MGSHWRKWHFPMLKWQIEWQLDLLKKRKISGDGGRDREGRGLILSHGFKS